MHHSSRSGHRVSPLEIVSTTLKIPHGIPTRPSRHGGGARSLAPTRRRRRAGSRRRARTRCRPRAARSGHRAGVGSCAGSRRTRERDSFQEKIPGSFSHRPLTLFRDHARLFSGSFHRLVRENRALRESRPAHTSRDHLSRDFTKYIVLPQKRAAIAYRACFASVSSRASLTGWWNCFLGAWVLSVVSQTESTNLRYMGEHS